jgi:hypothetical protein
VKVLPWRVKGDESVATECICLAQLLSLAVRQNFFISGTLLSCTWTANSMDFSRRRLALVGEFSDFSLEVRFIRAILEGE